MGGLRLTEIPGMVTSSCRNVTMISVIVLTSHRIWCHYFRSRVRVYHLLGGVIGLLGWPAGLWSVLWIPRFALDNYYLINSLVSCFFFFFALVCTLYRISPHKLTQAFDGKLENWVFSDFFLFLVKTIPLLCMFYIKSAANKPWL